ncbi:SMI1/KNR4 family protein [Priestia megaterium]|uniref:SMI1/KNR4 family protein n=1 Tax=Priestia megaterium TaxID=1404 RepID=UPI002A6A7890|nr:SMI1/KNR4 family protein [Priestia megaterium]MDY0943417.1 SMI1/KNR4 family protein [Priestia megaterium]
MSIEWLFCSEQEATLKDVVEVEKKFGIKFPIDYIDCILENHEGYPSLNAFDYGKVKGAAFNHLLSFNQQEIDYLVQVRENIKDRLIDRVYPFADTPGGDYLCFDYRTNEENPPIVYWDHELAYEDPEEGVFFVANTFTELLSKLYNDEE